MVSPRRWRTPRLYSAADSGIREDRTVAAESIEDLEKRWQQVSLSLRMGGVCLIPWTEQDARSLLNLRQKKIEKKKSRR
jgi:hypothetical protein